MSKLKQISKTKSVKTMKSKNVNLKIYNKELGVFPHPRSMTSIKALGIKRGAESGFKMAEAFYIIRKLIE